MKVAIPLLGRFLAIVLLFSCISCNTASQIDDYFTFNLQKSQNLPVPPETPVGQDTNIPSIPVGIDSSDLTTNGASLSLVKSAKLTKLVFTPSDSSYPMTSFDTITLSISTD